MTQLNKKIKISYRGSSYQNTTIIKETEKAYQLHANFFGRTRTYDFTFWFPKSQFNKFYNEETNWLSIPFWMDINFNDSYKLNKK